VISFLNWLKSVHYQFTVDSALDMLCQFITTGVKLARENPAGVMITICCAGIPLMSPQWATGW
ncbi:hypothetical protein ACPCJS_18365, partial [Klebsiella pneumoniae]|uniref:hypothetical protein n=1 Tax=Klebsiella pneumoniae TaxID=573 RepID=UPI001D0CF9F0